MSTVIEYTDPVEGARGWLVYDATDCRLAAGGCRVQRGLTAQTLVALAGRMTLKERLLRINVDGAKCGLDYDPASPAKEGVLGRFIGFLAGELRGRLSLGCDMGTRWPELEQLAARQGVPSVKYAIKSAQELSHDDFMTRIGLLSAPVGQLSLGERRAGHALAQVAIAAARAAGLREPVTCALQGFGNLGRAAACSLIADRVRLVAIADEYGCAADPRCLDVARMLGAAPGVPAHAAAAVPGRPSADVFAVPADMLVLAATEDALTDEQAAALQSPVVVVGANCGLRPAAEQLLHDRGILVISDFIGGIGGSASMEVLFGAGRLPDPPAVLRRLTLMMRDLVGDLTESAARHRAQVRDIALAIAAQPSPDAGGRPYGGSPYLRNLPSMTHASLPVAAVG
ncbi:MAG TPA: Glu/Leu/Phe/Val dehydrogenase dimerization domain-containing protein [Streptosporangiaceae bacterium]|nr:Glu/Leu/Phe/Val dehydrogenase dimerization domain-containing protein [Streptosporangiaceae bacterium]